jgi:hypothetical protein
VSEHATRYARSGDVHIAYQVTGEGPFDIVFVPGFVTHLELAWTFAASSRCSRDSCPSPG